MRQVIALGGLLAVALTGSYLTWTADETAELGADEVAIYSAAIKDLSSVAWKSEKLDVELRPGSDDKGEYVMVHVTERREKVKPKPLEPPKPGDDGHGHDEPGEDEGGAEAAEEGEEDEVDEEPAEIETTVTYFKGNKAANDLLASLAPLVAMRELVLPADADLADYGLVEPSATIEVHRTGGLVTLKVGGETFGAKDRYVRADNRTFLVDDQTLRPLQYAKTRLLERNLQPLSEPDIQQIKVVAGERSISFVQKNADDRTKAFWAASDTADTEHEVAGTWLGKAFKMRARTYVEPADLPELVPVFTYVASGAEESWTVEVFKSAEDENTWYAKPDFLRATVELTASLASDAAADLEALFPSG